MKNKGFALVSVLVLSTVLLLMGMGGMYMTEMGFRSLSAEQRWHRLEKAANAGIMQVAGRIQNGEECTINTNLNFNGATVEIQTIRAGSGCFIWSRATIGNSRVVKTAVLTSKPSTDANYLGAANFASLNELKIKVAKKAGGKPSGYIASCDPGCPTPALVIGNQLKKPPPVNLVSSCSNNLRGLTALVDPYVPNAFGQDEKLISRVFNGANNRNELWRLLTTEKVGVNFSSDGRPYIINVPPQCNFEDYTSCSTSEQNKIICYKDKDKGIIITWSNGAYNITDTKNKPIAQCLNVKLPDSTIDFNSPFTGGGIIEAKRVNLGSNISNVTFVAETVNLGENGTIITNVNAFAKSISLRARDSTWEGGILYTGGGNAEKCEKATDGCFSININSNTRIGTQDNPVLLISDNIMRIDTKGRNTQINGLIYLTENSRRFRAKLGKRNSHINGMIVSDLRKGGKKPNASMDISHGSGIIFDRNVLNNLAAKYNFVKGSACGATKAEITLPFIQTKTTTY